MDGQEWYHAKVLLKKFHLNGHTIGFGHRLKIKNHATDVSIIVSGSETVSRRF